MARNSKIEWTDHTVNLWWGCAKVHAGCKNCYAEKIARTYNPKGVESIWGESAERRRIKSAFGDLARYQRQGAKEGKKLRIFVGSMMDIFEDSRPLQNETATTGELRDRLFGNITSGMYPNLVFLFLTKRPGNIHKMIPGEWTHGVENVWFGTSVSNEETMKYADRLVQLKFQNLFLSIEPQIEDIKESSFGHWMDIDWIIQGGESGQIRRAFDIMWAERMRSICRMYSIPYFFKQIDKVHAIPEDMDFKEFPTFY